jgi:hypothetical protein
MLYHTANERGDSGGILYSPDTEEALGHGLVASRRAWALHHQMTSSFILVELYSRISTESLC